MAPAVSSTAVTAAQVAAQKPGAYPPRPTAAHTSIGAEKQSTHSPSQPSFQPTVSAVTETSHSTKNDLNGRGSGTEPYRDYHSGGKEPPDPPLKNPDQFLTESFNGGLAYENPRHQPKDKSNGGNVRNMIKRLGTSLMAEPRRDMRADYSLETDKERYKRERNTWKQRYHELEDINDCNISIIEELQGELAKEQDRVDRTKRSANLLEAAMDNKEVFLGIQARNDDEVRIKFSSILSSIKTWSNNFNAGSGHLFKEEMLPEYQRIVPLCTNLDILESLVDDKKRKRLFVRGWTAYVMTKSLFRTLDPLGDVGADVWMRPELADTFLRLENEMWYTDRKLITHRAFNDWRAFTADLLSKTLSDEKSDVEKSYAIQNAVYDVMDLVAPWCIIDDCDVLQGHEDRLQKIFTEAVQLAQFFRRQRSLWSVKFPSRPIIPGLQETGPLMYDPISMRDDWGNDEEVHLEQPRYVDIVVTPALYKRGNTNGERFETEEVSVPGTIVMGIAK